jgi:hypothetical protein
MTHSKAELSAEIIELAEACWDTSAEPLLLSKLGPALKNGGFDYKSILLEQGLGSFISNEVDELKIVKHPSQYAKIGVLPAAAEYSYEEYKAPSTNELTEQDRLIKSRRAFYDFIKAISKLPPEDIEDVNIPTRVIVRLLEGK